MLELRGLCAGYGGRPVLRDVTLRFPAGTVTAVLGPNGCGKSTLLRASLGLLPRTGGDIFLDGDAIDALTPRQIAQRAAYLAQSRPVPSITARHMVLHGRFPYLGYPRRYRPQDYAIARQALEAADAWALADCPLPELSGGQRQKVYLAMALAQDTDTVLMDEPTTFLDIGHQLSVMETARTLAAQGKAVVLVLHDLCLALRFADRLAVLEDGRLQAVGAPEEVASSGVLDALFGVSLRRTDTPDGPQYYYA